nr:PREDICTED: transcriptional regulator ATRX isoform X2 [Linepithema humile]
MKFSKNFKREVKATSQELLYRGKCFHDIRVVKDRQIVCTSCGNELNIESNKIFSHPFLGILQCEVCWNRINKVEEESDNDDNYCYICGDNKKLYDCSNKNCSAAFCKKCIKRNASLSLLNAEKENWKCFMCDSKPFWELRAVCAAVMDSLSKKNNRRSSRKIDRRMFPSEKERLKKQGRIQKVLSSICDDSGNDLPEEQIVRSTRRVKSAVYLTDSSSESSSTPCSNRSTLRKQRQNRADQKAKASDRWNSKSSSRQKVLRSNVREKDASHGKEKFDSDNDSIDTLSNKSAIKTDKKLKSKRNSHNYTDSSDNESENVDNKSRSKKRSRKVGMLCSSSEESIKYKKQKSTRRITVIQKENSDANSSEEFQKEKLQKVNGNKFLARPLVDLKMDYTHTPSPKILASRMKESELNIDNIKETLKECKEICSNFQMYIQFLEQRYGRKDADQLLIKSTEKIEKLSTMLQTKNQKLTTFYESWSKSKNRTKAVAKKSQEIVSDADEETSEEETYVRKERSISKDQHSATRKEQVEKDVSECDSDEIFSADEMRSAKKEGKDSQNSAKTDANQTLMDNSKDSDANDSRDATASPVLGTAKEKKTNEERSIKKQLFSKSVNTSDNEVQSTDNNSRNDEQADANIDTSVNETEIEDSPFRDGSKKKTSDDNSRENIINESTDMFDASSDTSKNGIEDQTKEQEIHEKAKSDMTRSLSKVDSSKKSKTLSCQETEVSSKRLKISLSSHNSENEKDSPSRDDQDKVESASANDEKEGRKEENIHDAEGPIVNDTPKKAKSTAADSSDTEAVAKKTLPESDFSETHSTTFSNEDVNADNIGKKRAKSDDSDSNTSTVILPINRKMKGSAKNSFTKAETQILGRENSGQPDNDIVSSSKENAKKKQAVLEQSSSDIDILSSSESEDGKNESRLCIENLKAKQALLASSSEENSDSEPEADTARVAQNTKRSKRNHEPEDDGDLSTPLKKKKKLQLNKNSYYRNDEKLRMSCKVHLMPLNEKLLSRHSYALRKSREYLEQKAFKSLVNLDNIEKRRNRKEKESNTDDDDDALSNKRKNSSKRKEKQAEETLMDHLKRIENDDALAIKVERADLSSDESVHLEKIKEIGAPVSNETLISEANRIAKENLLNSSDSDEKEVELLDDSDDGTHKDDENKNTEDKTKRKKTEKQEEKKDDDKKDKTSKNWRKDKILTMKFSDTESEAEKQKWNKKQKEVEQNNDSDEDDKEQEISKKKRKKKKTKRRILDSDSDIKLTDCSSEDSDNTSEDSDDKQKRKRGGNNSSEEEKPKPKRKRIKKMASDSDSSDCKIEVNNSQGSTPGKSGRKNIRKVWKDKQVAEDTKLAAKEEEERLKRIAERQALYNDMYEMRLAGEEKVDKLVLDFDTETKKELVSVHEGLVKRLKPHQAQGIKFMWDACYESLERAKTTSGSGCIIAHCMGLGKTLQVIALTYTLLTQEELGVKTVLIVCPLSTVLNWRNEYNSWLKDLDDIEVYELTKFKKNFERKYQLQRWQKTGGVMILGYEMFRNLTRPNKNIRKGMREAIEQYLVDPGADLVVCDEGHLLKNEESAISKCMRRVKTLRRIVLTGTPLQNNLIEYHCMVQFVKPNLLGTKKEFLNRFVNPIQNGQFDDSTTYDVKIMKKRAHVLHKMLEGSVQRFDYSVLTPFLPPKQEYVIFVQLTDIQIKMYEYYLANLARNRKQNSGGGGTLFADYQALQRIWTHPMVLRWNAAKIEKANEKKLTSDSEGSLRDFIDDDTSDAGDSSNSNSDSDVQAIDEVPKRKTRNNPGEDEPEEEVREEAPISEAEWWTQFVQPEHFEDLRVSAKLSLVFEIVKECEQIGDKLLIFSQSLYSLTLIEEFLRRIDDQTQKDTSLKTLNSHTGSWSLGLDYFRLDGQTSAENRSIWCKIFNKPTNTRARLFLISTRAGGLGINLTAANRVIIFDASWNPSHDVQSIFRVYRFGQKKPCYVYRFLAAGTMEEKIYNRQVTKLSLSCRVVDEQQIDRHFSTYELSELYMLEPYKSGEDKPTLNLPKDRLLADILLRYKDVVENYHEHDSLLKNQAEEELDEEERKQAWLEYEEEKKGKPPINSFNSAHQNFLLQQYMMNAGMMQQGIQSEYETIHELCREQYPNATPEQLKLMTNRAVIDTYNYWEKQAALKQPMRNPMNMQQNYQQKQMMPHTAGNINAHQQISQLNQLLASGGYVNVNKTYERANVQPNVAQRPDLVTNPFTYPKVSTANNYVGKETIDIIEIPTTSNASTSNAQVSVQSTDKSKDKEE